MNYVEYKETPALLMVLEKWGVYSMRQDKAVLDCGPMWTSVRMKWAGVLILRVDHLPALGSGLALFKSTASVCLKLRIQWVSNGTCDLKKGLKDETIMYLYSFFMVM